MTAAERVSMLPEMDAVALDVAEVQEAATRQSPVVVAHVSAVGVRDSRTEGRWWIVSGSINDAYAWSFRYRRQQDARRFRALIMEALDRLMSAPLPAAPREPGMTPDEVRATLYPLSGRVDVAPRKRPRGVDPR